MMNFNESENYSDFFESDGDNKISPIPFEDISDLPIFINEKEESHSSYSIPDKNGNPLFINNENFINYFMHIDYNTPLNSEKKNSSSQLNSPTPLKETNITVENDKKEILLKKTKREKKYEVITDKLTGIIYDEKNDPINFRKAKKRIQNRESALRMKKLRANNMCKIDEELNRLKEDNMKLINENISLKKEKMFLIEQIKFMQKIIKESNLEFKLKNTCNNIIDNENKKKENEAIPYYGGAKQKIKGKLFNVFMVCILSIVYIVGECHYDSQNENSGENRKRNNENAIHLNSIKNKENKNSNIFWFYISKFLLVVIFYFIFPWIKYITCKIMDLAKKRRRKKYI